MGHCRPRHGHLRFDSRQIRPLNALTTVKKKTESKSKKKTTRARGHKDGVLVKGFLSFSLSYSQSFLVHSFSGAKNIKMITNKQKKINIKQNLTSVKPQKPFLFRFICAEL
jgi:hypothetical protein